MVNNNFVSFIFFKFVLIWFFLVEILKFWCLMVLKILWYRIIIVVIGNVKLMVRVVVKRVMNVGENDGKL